MHKTKVEIDKETRTYEHIEEIREILERNISIPRTQSVQKLGRKTLKQQENTKAKDEEEAKQIDIVNREMELDINISKGE